MGRLEDDVDEFSLIFEETAVANAKGSLAAMKAPRAFEWLLNEMASRNLGALLVRLVFSDIHAVRRLGFFLLDKLPGIELFLIWRSLWRLERFEDIKHWLHNLRSNLLIRRVGRIPLPFVEGGNSLDLVFETVATGNKPAEFKDQSSLLVLFLLEICLGLDEETRNEQLEFFCQHIVLGRDSGGGQLNSQGPLAP